MRFVCPLLLALTVPLIGTACSRQESKAETTSEPLKSGEDGLLHNHFDVAERNFRAILRQAPAQPGAVRGLALLYSEQGQWPIAVPLLKQAAELNPEDAEIQTKLGLAFLLTRDFKSAREAALKALELAPKLEDGAILLADTTDSRTASEEIRPTLDALAQKNGDQAAYHVARGVLEVRQDNDNAAEQQFQEALRLNA